MKRVVTVFQRLDHSSIFLLITGTYTPFLIVYAKSTEAYILFGVLWGLTIIGIVLKSIWLDKFKYVHLSFYLIMGWSILFISDQMGGLSNLSLSLLFAGGLSYTFGVIFYVSKFKYQHFIWHLFVLAGSILHFIGVITIY